MDVTLTSDKTALFVWLTTAEHGRFSDNSFVLLPGTPVRPLRRYFGQPLASQPPTPFLSALHTWKHSLTRRVTRSYIEPTRIGY